MRRRGTAAAAAHSYLIIFRGGDKEEDGGDRVEALKPAPSLRPLPAHIHHLEGNVLDFKVILVDPFGGFTGQQDVLLARKITLEERGRAMMNKYHAYTCRKKSNVY